MRTIVFGAIEATDVIKVKEPTAWAELDHTKAEHYPGGRGFEAAVALARLGVDTAIAGVAGVGAEEHREILLREGVDCTHLLASDEPVPVRTMQKLKFPLVGRADKRAGLTDEETDAALEGFGEEDWALIFDDVLGAHYAVKAAKKRGLTVVFSPGDLTVDSYDESIHVMDYVWFESYRQANAFTGKQEYFRAAEYARTLYGGKTQVLLTNGMFEGVYLVDGYTQPCWRRPLKRKEMTDDCAVRAAYIAMFIHARGRLKVNMMYCTRLGLSHMSLALVNKGAYDRLPTLDDFILARGNKKKKKAK